MTDEQERLSREGLLPAGSEEEQEETGGAFAMESTVSKNIARSELPFRHSDNAERKYIAYTVKLPSEQLAALQSIWLELKHLYGAHSPDKSGMIQQAVEDWLKRWDGPERRALLDDLLQIRQDTRRRQYRKTL
ncbi:MAG: hypothetical protein C5B53_00190 [Candidatus Melainabacteria bacterium]|nr:MAG: hypothetical protein C5B53_00190 [Candidatus Melainabacteria bacterium]